MKKRKKKKDKRKHPFPEKTIKFRHIYRSFQRTPTAIKRMTLISLPFSISLARSKKKSVWTSPNIAPKPNDLSRSNSISSVPLQISLAIFILFFYYYYFFFFFVFDLSSKMAETIFIKFCGFIVHSNPNNMALSAFPGKNLVTRIFF